MSTIGPVVASIVIPAFNRLAPLEHTLASARAACDALGAPAEILLVDDGSEPPLAAALPRWRDEPRLRLLRQPNQGSIVARLTGLRAAQGEFVLFLDSDDLVAPEKLLRHAGALRASGASVSYDDIGETVSSRPAADTIRLRESLAPAANIPELLLRVQPAPHGCIFRRDYLLRALATPVIPPERALDAVGDVWLYYNLAVHDAPIVKVDAPLTLTSAHDEARYSHHWEKLGLASLGVMERFVKLCPPVSATQTARTIVGECAFNSWRRLPRDIDAGWAARLVAVWQRSPRGQRRHLGGPLFQALALVLGPVNAGRLLRRRNATYASCRTLDDAALAPLLRS